MATIKRLTLDEYLDQFSVTVVEVQPASAVPASYRGKPKDQQVMTGVKNIEEVLLSDGNSVFICVDDKLVYETAASATSHRSRSHRLGDKEKDLTEVDVPDRETAIQQHFEVMKEIGQQAEEDRKVTRGKKRKVDNPEVKVAGENVELPSIALHNENVGLKRELDSYKQRLEAAMASAQQWRDMYDDLKRDYDLLQKAHDNLKRAYDELEAGIVSDVLRTRLRFMFTDALGDFFNKVETAVAHQANSNKELKSILES